MKKRLNGHLLGCESPKRLQRLSLEQMKGYE